LIFEQNLHLNKEPMTTKDLKVYIKMFPTQG